MEIALIADKDTATCFKLAGLKHIYPVINAAEAEKRITELSEKPDFAIVLITDHLAEQIHSMIEKIAEHKHPLIIPIPNTRRSGVLKTDLIVELIRRKVGVEVKL